MSQKQRIYLAELAREVERMPNTVRGWCQEGRLPRSLRPRRESKLGWRYWTPEQVEGVKRWMAEVQRQDEQRMLELRERKVA